MLNVIILSVTTLNVVMLSVVVLNVVTQNNNENGNRNILLHFLNAEYCYSESHYFVQSGAFLLVYSVVNTKCIVEERVGTKPRTSGSVT